VIDDIDSDKVTVEEQTGQNESHSNEHRQTMVNQPVVRLFDNSLPIISPDPVISQSSISIQHQPTKINKELEMLKESSEHCGKKDFQWDKLPTFVHQHQLRSGRRADLLPWQQENLAPSAEQHDEQESSSEKSFATESLSLNIH